MNRRLVHVIAISLLISLAGGHVVFAQKSRRRSAAASRVKKGTKTKRSASRRATVSRKAKNRSRSGGRVSARRRRARVASRPQGRASRDAQETTSAAAPQRIPSGIPTERVIEIQTALGKMGYYEGPPSGQWDENTTEAMKQFQAASGLATTGLPSAFTLKKLGVPKTSRDGYSVPIKSVSRNDKKP
jgi:hypothetical protein